MRSNRRFFAVYLGLMLSSAACTAILVPDEKDDGVERCNTTEDCSTPSDNRHQAACVFGTDQDPASDKVCTVVYDGDVACNPENFPLENIIRETWEDADLASDAYVATCDPAGGEGCPASTGCNDGLVEGDFGTCVDPDDHLQAVNTFSFEGIEAGQDVGHQLCRYYFCDDRFVCNYATGKCEICSEGSGPADGGCVEIHVAGAPSSIYLPADAGNCDGNKAVDEVEFGPVPGG
jgi:hypothetical protein